MDSLHVSGQQQQSSSKASSRSTSPCRMHSTERSERAAAAAAGDLQSPQQHPLQQQTQPPQPHHTKSLSHGSADSNKSDSQARWQHQHRRRSPGAPTSSSSASRPAEMDDSHLDDCGAQMEAADTSDLAYPSSFISNGSSEHVKPEDESDAMAGGSGGLIAGNTRTNATIEHLGNKIIRVRDLIRTEQKLRDDNVSEYLKLVTNADKQQVQRIKAVFEKKNQKSAQVISQLQKKLDNYQKRLHELETHGVVPHRPPREVLRDMGQGLKNVGGNIRDGISGFGGSVMSKPREFAHLIKNRFGSADNISQLSRPGTTGSEGSGTNGGAGSDQGEKSHHHHHHHSGSATLPATLHSANSNTSMGQSVPQKFPSEEGSECSSVTSESLERYHGRTQEDTTQDAKCNAMYKQLLAAREEIAILRKKVDGSDNLQEAIQFLSSSIQDERFKTERLEEQINDLTELHQNEVENLKQAMADMEEKVQYQSEERLRDIHEILEHCQTKIQKMEHQALQQQQYVTLEGLDNSNARAFAVKLINVLLTVLQVVLLLVATCAGIIMPFLRTRVRILTTLTIVFIGIFVLRQWPEVADIGSHVMKRLKDMLDPVK